MKEKQKKFKKFIQLLVLVFLISLSPKILFAKNYCGEFLYDLKTNFNELRPNDVQRWSYNDFGFDLLYKYDVNKEEWVLDKSKEGYLEVNRITDETVIDKINIGDLIISANGEKIENFNITDDKEFFDFFEDNEEVNFKIKRNKKFFEVKLKKKDKSLMAPYFDFYVKSIELNEKSNKTEARIVIDAQEELDKEFGLTKSAMKNMKVISEGQDDYFTSCTFEVEDWDENSFANPFTAKFLDIHRIDYNTFESYIEVKAYDPAVVKSHKETLGWDDQYATIDYFSDGLYVFNNDFNLKNFPFDKQKLVFQVKNNFHMTDGLLRISNASELHLIDFVKKKKISGWNMTDGSLKYAVFKDPYDINLYDSALIEIDIERKYSYYLYKVILPILLILMICWSSLWIPAREIESKLTITIVCLLSLIAYNFVIDKDLPKLEYLTTLDWIILISYFYATIPNFFAIVSFNLKNDLQLGPKIDSIGKKYGALSYILIIFFIIVFNVNLNPDNAAAVFSWMAAR